MKKTIFNFFSKNTNSDKKALLKSLYEKGKYLCKINEELLEAKASRSDISPVDLPQRQPSPHEYDCIVERADLENEVAQMKKPTR